MSITIIIITIISLIIITVIIKEYLLAQEIHQLPKLIKKMKVVISPLLIIPKFM
jgi:hypothetical protein